MQNSKIRIVIKNYIKNNNKEYILATLLFLIGLFTGVLIINNLSDNDITNIETYINNFFINFKSTENIDKLQLISTSIKNNVFLALIIWGAGTTIIGIPIVLIVILYRGIILGYTISAFSIVLGTYKGLLFCLITIFLQNILFIPAILTLGVSSIKLYKSIIKDRRRENIKVGVIRHTIIALLMTIILILSSVFENVVPLGILKKFIIFFSRKNKKTIYFFKIV